jgi:FemAB-related protein (PEP-CTERM system-associated)
MISSPAVSSARPTTVRLLHGKALAARLPRLETYACRGERVPLSRHPRWLSVLGEGLQHEVYALEALSGEETLGLLALAYVRSLLFGRYLVGLPYLNSGGVLADDDLARQALVDGAVRLADSLNVRHLELRHEQPVEHPALTGRLTTKVHMRLALPSFPGPLWEQLPGKVRNQVRKAEKGGLTVAWGREELLPEFYEVFSRNMRDLGTPVYGRGLFRSVLARFPGDAELCVVRDGDKPLAGALLLHGKGVTEVPSASSLREYNHTCANMLLYWNLLDRAIQRGQAVFDFGRSTVDGNTYKFKKQWGARPEPATWQYYVRRGSAGDLRPDNPRYQRFIRLWQRLPVALTRFLGPRIVRGIP